MQNLRRRRPACNENVSMTESQDEMTRNMCNKQM